MRTGSYFYIVKKGEYLVKVIAFCKKKFFKIIAKYYDGSNDCYIP